MNKRKHLRKLDGKRVSVYSGRSPVVSDILFYEGKQCFVGQTQVPIRSMRNIAPWDNGPSKALIFVDPKYSLRRVS